MIKVWRPSWAGWRRMGVLATSIMRTSAGRRVFRIEGIPAILYIWKRRNWQQPVAIIAVMHTKLGICQSAFYRAGEIEISKDLKVGMDSQCMAMFKMQGDRVGELTASDPSRNLNRVIVTVSGIYKSQGDILLRFRIRIEAAPLFWWICHRVFMQARVLRLSWIKPINKIDTSLREKKKA
jgi:hypothetical protein